MRKELLLSVCVGLLAVPGFAQRAQPEEHEEHCVTEKYGSARSRVFDADFGRAVDREVRRFVRSASANTGWLEVRDSVEDRLLRLELVKVVSDPTSIDGSRAYSCARFRASSGEVVDLDFVFDTSSGRPLTREATLHAVDDVQRYEWVEEEGVLVRRPPSD